MNIPSHSAQANPKIKFIQRDALERSERIVGVARGEPKHQIAIDIVLEITANDPGLNQRIGPGLNHRTPPGGFLGDKARERASFSRPPLPEHRQFNVI